MNRVKPYAPAEHEVGLLAEAGEVVAEEEGVVDLGAGERVHELLAVGPNLLKISKTNFHVQHDCVERGDARLRA